MITSANTEPPTYYGLSKDAKPTLYIQNGAAFIEMDTSKLYLFDASDSSWNEWGSS